MLFEYVVNLKSKEYDRETYLFKNNTKRKVDMSKTVKIIGQRQN